MAWVKSELDTFIKRNVLPKVRSNFATTKPLLALLVGQDTAELEKLGDPNTSAVFGGRDLMGESTREVVSGDLEHEITYQEGQIDQTSTIGYRESTPTASTWSEDQFATAAVRWSDYWQPFKFGQHSVESAATDEGQGDLRIESIVELNTQLAYQRMLEKMQSDLWTGTLTSAQQNNRLWKQGIIGVQHAVDDGGATSAGNSSYATYARVDRSASGHPLQAIVKDASTEAANGEIDSDVIHLDLIRKARLKYGLVKNLPSAGNFAITGLDEFEVLLQEADDRNLRIIEGDVPEMGMEGFKTTVIQHGNTMITYDPDCPSGELYVLTPRSWMFEVERGANFQLEDTIHEKWRQEEGGGYYNWGQIRAKCRLVCTEPWLQFKWTNLKTG